MPTYYVTPTINVGAGIVESAISPYPLCGAGIVDYNQPAIKTGGGIIEETKPAISVGGGITEICGVAVKSQAGVVEQLNVYLTLGAGVVEVLAPVAALTEEFYSFVMNTKTAGFSEYTNFPFTSLFRAGTNFYGITAEGLQLLTGDNDNGAQIKAEIVTGPCNLGTSDIKYIPSMYAHMRGGEIEVATKIDDKEDNPQEWCDPYNAINPGNGIKPVYISMARGAKGVYIQFKISNAEGADFDLAKFEQNFVDSGRKR
jgi:hypothetical protein